jgi:hypothetical protein
MATIVGLVWYLAARHQASGSWIPEMILGVCLGVIATLGANAFLAD